MLQLTNSWQIGWKHLTWNEITYLSSVVYPLFQDKFTFPGFKLAGPHLWPELAMMAQWWSSLSKCKNDIIINQLPTPRTEHPVSMSRIKLISISHCDMTYLNGLSSGPNGDNGEGTSAATSTRWLNSWPTTVKQLTNRWQTADWQWIFSETKNLTNPIKSNMCWQTLVVPIITPSMKQQYFWPPPPVTLYLTITMCSGCNRTKTNLFGRSSAAQYFHISYSNVFMRFEIYLLFSFFSFFYVFSFLLFFCFYFLLFFFISFYFCLFLFISFYFFLFLFFSFFVFFCFFYFL